MPEGHFTVDGLTYDAQIVEVDHISQPFLFSAPFDRTPVILSTVASNNDQVAVTTRLEKANKSGFSLYPVEVRRH